MVFPFQVPSPVQGCPALYWQVVACSAGGDGGRRSPELPAAQPAHVVCGSQRLPEKFQFISQDCYDRHHSKILRREGPHLHSTGKPPHTASANRVCCG